MSMSYSNDYLKLQLEMNGLEERHQILDINHSGQPSRKSYYNSTDDQTIKILKIYKKEKN
jgi:hypothetical protein